jgi:hypothetical protein
VALGGDGKEFVNYNFGRELWGGRLEIFLMMSKFGRMSGRRRMEHHLSSFAKIHF